MDMDANEFIESLLREDTHKLPSDTGSVRDLEEKMHLPEWFDEAKYNNGRRFFWHYCYGFSVSMTIGLVVIFSVPSMTSLFVSTRRSNSAYTSYYRTRSTLMHTQTWFREELKPGTKSWKSLHAVRSRHLRAGKTAMLKGSGIISQRDMALAVAGFTAFGILNPGHFGIRQIRSQDWDDYNYYWKTICYMLGLEDRFNPFRKNIDETREVFRMIQERVFTPCLENVPEYFEHLSRTVVEGLGILLSQLEFTSILFWIRYLHKVPGYVCTDNERIEFQKQLKAKLHGRSVDTGVDAEELICKSAVEGLPERPPRLLYLRDYDSIETAPAYKQLNFLARYRLTMNNIILTLYNTELGRYIFNLLFLWNNFINDYFPYKAFFKFGVKKSFVNMFVESPKDNAVPKRNSEYLKPPPPDSWFVKILAVLW